MVNSHSIKSLLGKQSSYNVLAWGTSMYYVRGRAYIIIVWKKMLNNLHKTFQGKRRSLESFYLLYGMFNRVLLEICCKLYANSTSSIAKALKLLNV